MSGDTGNAIGQILGGIFSGGKPSWAGTPGGPNGNNGGNGGNGTPNTPAAPTGFPAAMPGQLEAIAQQLGMGFGSPPGGGDFLSYLNNIYKPMPMPSSSPSDSDKTSKGRSAAQDKYLSDRADRYSEDGRRSTLDLLLERAGY